MTFGARLFICDCGDPWHSLYVAWDDVDKPYLCVAVVVEPSGWRQRLKAAWACLRGRRHFMHEVYVSQHEMKDFVEYVNRIPEAPQPSSS